MGKEKELNQPSTMLFSKQTPAAGGTAFAQFDAAWCYDGNGYILNETGTSLDVRIGATGSVITLAAGGTLPIKLVYSMAELYVRRTDQSTTQVTVEAQVGTGSAGGGGSTADMAVIAAASTAAHNADATAHGFGVYTVAQLNTFTNANRPPGCVYCSDCLVPEGVGSPVVWNGAQWVCTCSGLPATTDALVYFRGLRRAGRDHFAEKGTFHRVGAVPYGVVAAALGTGAARGITGDNEGVSYYTGTTATGWSANSSSYSHHYALGAGPRKAPSDIYTAGAVYFLPGSTSAEAFHVHHGFKGLAQNSNVLSDYEIAFFYDPQNATGLNSGGSANYLAVCRNLGVNTIIDTGVAGVATWADRRDMEIHATASSARFFIGGVLVANITTNIPTASIRSNLSITKTNGSTLSSITGHRVFTGCRYSD